MSLRVLLSARARRDIDAIHAYIAARSPLNAPRFVARLEEEIGKLGDIGPALSLAPESRHFRFELRQMVVWPYRVLYRVRGREVHVLHVRHGARLSADRDRRGNPK